MMAFGRDQMLKKDEVENVVNYVRSLSDPAVAKDVPAAKMEAGKAVFAANCVACHGDDAKGKTSRGIYKFDGDDKLIWCFRPEGDDRPTEYEMVGFEQILGELVRERK